MFDSIFITGSLTGENVLLALGLSLLAWATQDEWLGLSLSFLLERPDPWFYLLPVLWLILMIPLYNIRNVHLFQTALKVVITAAASSLPGGSTIL